MTAAEPPEDNDALLRMAQRLDGRLSDLSLAIRDETQSRRIGFLLATIAIIIALAAAGVGIYSAYDTRRTANCTADWAKAYQSRSLSLTQVNNTRTDAIDKFDRSVAVLANTIGLPRGQAGRKAFQHALTDLVAAGKALEKADRDYQTALRRHPVGSLTTKLDC